MTPDEVIKKLHSLGVKTSRTTLLRFLQRKLIPEPIRGGDGRGKGRFTEYPPETPFEYFAADVLLNKPYRFSYDEVAEFRKFALYINSLSNDEIGAISQGIYEDLKETNMESPPAWYLWWKLKILSQNNCEIVKFNGVISSNIEVPKGLDVYYDKIQQGVDNYVNRRLVRIVFDQHFKVAALKRMVLDMEKRLAEYHAEIEKEQFTLSKLHSYFIQLDQNNINYANKVFRVYCSKPNLREKLELIVRERFRAVSDEFIQILQNIVKKEIANNPNLK